MKQSILILTLTISTTLLIGQDQPIELGQVNWLRDYDQALEKSTIDNKPILILFQEVPGCATCRNYGQNVLSHPLMVDAIENEFIPLAIFNNKGGKDKEILIRYNEPSWNNPVVRIVNSDGFDIVNRLSGNYSAKGLYKSMVQSLKKEEKEIPEYVKLLGTEITSTNTEQTAQAYYKMYCFWSGEKHLGAADGVVSTEPGFLGGHEVVKVVYDKNGISERSLTKYASSASIKPINDDGSYRFASADNKYYLRRSEYKYLPLSILQQSKINSAIGSGRDASIYLSPTQLQWLTQIASKQITPSKELYNKDLSSSWNVLASLN